MEKKKNIWNLKSTALRTNTLWFYIFVWRSVFMVSFKATSKKIKCLDEVEWSVSAEHDAIFPFPSLAQWGNIALNAQVILTQFPWLRVVNERSPRVSRITILSYPNAFWNHLF